jgi:hypothetical protein
VRVVCTVKLVSGAAKRAMVHARLSRGAMTYARGHARGSTVRMRAVRSIRPGRYTLTTRVGRRAATRQRVTIA